MNDRFIYTRGQLPVKDLTPQERIDLMDLVRYAYTNKYIKRYTALRMDDPVRKVTQRILSKMFDGCGIVKSRSSDSYNISFEPDQLYHGDCTYYRAVDNHNGVSINLIVNSIANMEPFFSGKAFLDPQIFKILLVITDKEEPGIKQLNSFTSEWSAQTVKDIVGKYKDIKETANRKYTNKEIEQTQKDVTDIYKMISAFKSLMDPRAETMLEGIDPALRQLVNVDNIFTKQKYGFSLHYKNFRDSYRHRRNYGSGYEQNHRVPLVRRFGVNGPVIRILENYKKAFDIYNILKKQVVKYANVFAMLGQISYALEGNRRGTGRRSEQREKKFTLVLEFIDSITKDGVDVNLIGEENFVEVANVVQQYSDIYNTNLLDWIGMSEFDEDRNKRLKKLCKHAEAWNKARSAKVNAARESLENINRPIIRVDSTTSTTSNVMSWSTIATTDNSDDGGWTENS